MNAVWLTTRVSTRAVAWREQSARVRSSATVPPPAREGAAAIQRRRELMAVDSRALIEEGTPKYLASGDPNLADYYPAWLDNLANDAAVEGSMLDGAVEGAVAVRTIVTTIREMYGDS